MDEQVALGMALGVVCIGSVVTAMMIPVLARAAIGGRIVAVARISGAIAVLVAVALVAAASVGASPATRVLFS